MCVYKGDSHFWASVFPDVSVGPLSPLAEVTGVLQLGRVDLEAKRSVPGTRPPLHPGERYRSC